MLGRHKYTHIIPKKLSGSSFLKIIASPSCMALSVGVSFHTGMRLTPSLLAAAGLESQKSFHGISFVVDDKGRDWEMLRNF
jgi:hypothetical protein